MDVILLQKVENLGNLGDKVNVKPGYGRNFLVPQGLAAPATPENLEEFEKRREEFERQQAEALKAAEERKAKLEELGTVTITAKSGSEGKLFGSVGPIDIAEAITNAGVEVEKKEIRMAEGPIRVAGEHTVDIHLHSDIGTEFTVVVEGEE